MQFSMPILSCIIIIMREIYAVTACPIIAIMYIGNDIITSGKNFTKITSVGMGAAKSNETR